MENTKRCTNCGKNLPLTEFHVVKYKSGNTGHKSHCKECHNKKYRQWRKDNPGKANAAYAKWRKHNKRKAIESKNRCIKNRKSIDPSFKVKVNIMSAMSCALTGSRKCAHTTELLGCSIEELRNHLERLFQPDMKWDNYGRNGWHIDHVIPLTYFDMSDPEQQRRAWHYTNLQPLWAADNRKKWNKIEEAQLMLL